MNKAQQRRETMARFNAQLQTEHERLSGLQLSVTELIGMFHSDSFFTEQSAIGIVSKMDKEAIMSDVLAGMTDDRWKVRRTCADFLDHWGDERAVEPLLNALKDPHENVRRLALHSLTCQKCKVHPLEGDFVPALIDVARNDRSLRARRIATSSLENFLHDERALEALRDLAESSRDTAVKTRAEALLERQERGEIEIACRMPHQVMA